MKKYIKRIELKHFIFIFVIALIACNETNELKAPRITYSSENGSNNIMRSFRPVVLGKKKNNPFTVANMQAALDTLKAHPAELSKCMKAPEKIDEIEIKPTDLYVRFLPQDTAQYRQLMDDSTLTLFDFPLDYEITQNGDYYHDPSVNGDFTWLYTRVPVGYQPPVGVKYEVLAELFLMEHSPYYTEEVVNTPSNAHGMKVRRAANTDMNDALATIKAIAFFNTGNKYGETPKNNANTQNGKQKVQIGVRKHFLFSSWTDYEYFPSGKLSVQDYHNMDAGGQTTSYSSLTAVPLKGIKIHFWNWFKWNDAYTDNNGYYQSGTYYDGDPEHVIYFTGRNGANQWNLDRVAFGAISLWVQKFSLGVQSRDNYDCTINSNSDVWKTCLTNNAFYEYMTICDKELMTRPTVNLKVALRTSIEGNGSASTPMFQNHTNTYEAGLLGGFIALTFATGGVGAIATTAYIALTGGLPDIILTEKDIDYYISSKKLTQKEAISEYNSTIWHELTHASNLQRVIADKGYGAGSAFWTSLTGTEMGHFIFGGHPYGSKGDANWEQIALCEGWAFYRGWNHASNYLGYWTGIQNKNSFPLNYYNMFSDLKLWGCSNTNMEKCLNAKTFADFKQQMLSIYAADKVKCDNISRIIDNASNNY